MPKKNSTTPYKKSNPSAEKTAKKTASATPKNQAFVKSSEENVKVDKAVSKEKAVEEVLQETAKSSPETEPDVEYVEYRADEPDVLNLHQFYDARIVYEAANIIIQHAGDYIGIARILCMNVLERRLIWRDGTFYFYNNRYWEIITSDESIHSILHHCAGLARYKTVDRDGNELLLPFKATTGAVEAIKRSYPKCNLFGLIKSSLSAAITPDNTMMGDQTQTPYIVFLNGRLNTHTFEFTPSNDASVFNTYYLNFNYDPEALAPTFERFLEDMFPNAKHSATDEDGSTYNDSQAHLLEMMGEMLIRERHLQIFYSLFGEKRAGKTTAINVVCQLLNNDAVAATTIASIGSRFGLQPLIGAQLAVANDAHIDPSSANESLSAIKRFCGGDKLLVDLKGRQARSMRFNQTRLVMMQDAMNRLVAGNDFPIAVIVEIE